jgi:phosphoribosylformylglycinamidine cyclo-ligase
MRYRDAGVDVEAANQAYAGIRGLVQSTFDSRVLTDFGTFSGLYRPGFSELEKPILVSSADGVGTKLKVAFMTGVHDTVGVDLVAHCTNDILVHGAHPLFFMDYIATGKLDPQVVRDVVRGLVNGCREAHCVLLGGETAEMPDFYQEGEYDLAGFIVGMTDESGVPNAGRVRRGDLLVGLPSSGLHTNGFSLVRKLFFEQEKTSVDTYIDVLGKTLGEELLVPHRSYLPSLENVLGKDELHAIAHITGGGITDNLARVLPADLDARIRRGSWVNLPIFELIQGLGRVEEAEMFRTFNMGLGMILVVDRDGFGAVSRELERTGEEYVLVGDIGEGDGKVQYE